MTSRPRAPAGAVATSDPRATEAGAEVLRAGGNCVDAAVAATLVLFVVEPHHTGPGGDGFLLVRLPSMESPEALDGAGSIPAEMTTEALRRDGSEQIPAFGARSVSVPGAVGLLHRSLEAYGTREPGEVVAPAVRLAREGFAVHPTLASAISHNLAGLADDPVLAALYTVDGRPRGPGERVVNPALAAALVEFERRGPDPFYRGDVADDIVDTVQKAGGYLTRDDLARHRTLPVAPESTSFRERTVWQLGAPTQGRAVLSALERLAGVRSTDWDVVLDAVAGGLAEVGIDLPAPADRTRSGTSHVAVVDADGGAASLITSVLADFGARLGVESLGGALHNRAAGFRMVGREPRPGKPPHTLIPGLVTRGPDEVWALGVAGGTMQAQGQVQLLVRLLVEGEDVTAAVDAPRFRLVAGGEVALEPGHPLQARYSNGVGRDPGPGGFGSAQIAAHVDGTTVASADPRRDGRAVIVSGAGGRI